MDNNITYHKVAEYLDTCAVIKLENGVTLCALDGHVFGTDGKVYHHVGEEDYGGDLHTVGWSSEIDQHIILVTEEEAWEKHIREFEESTF